MPTISPDAALPASNRFLSYVGDPVQFFVPDTGAPGADVSGFDADGTEWPDGSIIVDQIDHTKPIKPTKDNPRPNQPNIVGRLSIRLAKPWSRPGVYRFVVVQDGTTTEYEYTVLVRAAYGNSDDERRLVNELKAWRRKCAQVDQTNDLSPNFEQKD